TMSSDASNSQVDLSGQVALVTGGGGGLGRAFALALASAGARVAVTARTAMLLRETAEMVERCGGRALAIPGDVAAPDDVRRVVTTTESQLGPIDILVNSAGVVGPVGCDWDIEPEEWWRAFEVTVLGSFRCARAGVGRHDHAQAWPDRQPLQRSRLQSLPPDGRLLRHESRGDAVDEGPGGGYEGTRDCGICLPPRCRAHADDRASERVARRPERGARQDQRPDEPGTRDADRTQCPDAAFPGLRTSG